MPLEYLWLLPLGLAVGAYGTLIGAGGGFVLVPILLLLYPEATTETITCISLAVVFCNALSGALAYARLKRIEYRSGLLFSAATIPGAILGALATPYLSRQLFDGLFGLLLIAVSVFLLARPESRRDKAQPCPPNHRTCTVTEANGTEHRFSYHQPLGIGVSLVVGFISSLLGIGGGIIHVPVMVHLLNFPVHIATATSQFVLANMALTGTMTHIVAGTFTQGIRRAVLLSIGVLLGAQLGARLSGKMEGTRIIRWLALALGAVGIRLVVAAV
ncbi:MAG: sulfite exporter TauE/SafE family protein [Deltaproteobacteria bacterium]|nr:sulfite exporter TauE/SafE family protein [Deltaproteobacteria bacterium]